MCIDFQFRRVVREDKEYTEYNTTGTPSNPVFSVLPPSSGEELNQSTQPCGEVSSGNESEHIPAPIPTRGEE
jgi:hypothetical protein